MIHTGEALAVLKTMPDEFVHCCVTSPPYWGLRDYGHDGQLGLEKTPEEYVARMVEIFREVRRVLRADGTLWLNLGDSYANTGVKSPESVGGFTGERIRKKIAGENPNDSAQDSRPRRIPTGLKPKDLVGVPWRVAFALQADGWFLRSDIIWHKPNPMPESVTDRPTKAHEYLFLLSKSARYYYDAEAIADRLETPPHAPGNIKLDNSRNDHDQMQRVWGASGTRNRRTVWTIATQPYSGAHFAVFPPKLIEPCIKAGTSQKGACSNCGAPWERVVERESVVNVARGSVPSSSRAIGQPQQGAITTTTTTKQWQPTCECDDYTDASNPGPYPRTPCVVLDPFMGAGTTAIVAEAHGREWVGIEINPEYVELAKNRLRDKWPLFSE